MKKHLLTPWLLCLIAFAFFGCAANRSDNPNAFGPDEPDGLPRMVISGVVRNTLNEPLGGIRIDLETKDPQPAASYNYALTDSKGAYTIIRYRGHEQPDSVTLYASDPAGMYLPQQLSAPVTYDSAYLASQHAKVPYNAFVNADFILETNTSE